MTKTITSKDFTRLQRSLIGGLISGLLCGILIALSEGGVPIEMLLFGFVLPLFLFDSLSQIVSYMVVITFWFLVGAAITYFVNKNLVAIVIWLAVYALSFILAFLSFASAMMGG